MPTVDPVGDDVTLVPVLLVDPARVMTLARVVSVTAVAWLTTAPLSMI
jgi:hypothetical protein